MTQQPVRRLPLEGVRVIEMSIAWAGPMAARILAELGAEIIKIEGPTKMDRWRGGTTPQRGLDRYADRNPGERPWNRNAFYNTQNVNKKSLSLNLKTERGREILRGLVAISDIVLENFSAGAMGRLGFEYDDLRAIKDDIVMVSMPGFGKTGPEASYVAHGPTIEAVAGNLALQGYENEGPLPSGLLAWGDPVAGITGGFAAVVAWTYHELTGRGTHVDLSHIESAIPMNFEAFLDFAIAGIERKPRGNRDPRAVLQGCYPCRGKDRWLVLSCPDVESWCRLAELVGASPDLDPRRDDAALCVAEERVRAWTAERDRDKAVAVLQEHDVPAGPVADAHDLNHDPHLAARGFFRTIAHPEAGVHKYPGMPWQAAERPWRQPAPAPLFGEHTDDILSSLLHLSAAEIEELYRAGVVAREPAPQAD